MRNEGEKKLLAQRNTTKAREILIGKGLQELKNIHELSHQDRDWGYKAPSDVPKMKENGLKTWLYQIKELKAIAQKELLINQRRLV